MDLVSIINTITFVTSMLMLLWWMHYKMQRISDKLKDINDDLNHIITDVKETRAFLAERRKELT